MSAARRWAARLWPAVAASLLATPGAHAEPSVWARARDPLLAREHGIIEDVDVLLHTARVIRLQDAAPVAAARSLVLRDAFTRLQQGGAFEATSPQLRYRAAVVLSELHALDRDDSALEQAAAHLRYVVEAGVPDSVVADASALEQAAAHLRYVVEAGVPDSVVADALSELAILHARLGQHHEEIDAYGRALALEPHVESRAVLLANRAEGFMALGEITAAVRGYEASLRATPSYLYVQSGVTTLWGLAVALDRSGDLDGGLARIRAARAYDATDQRLNGPGWFYVPAYDEAWYQALGHWQHARSESDAAERVGHYDQAMAAWSAYLARAAPGDHWVALAELRLQACERERAEALRRTP